MAFPVEIGREVKRAQHGNCASCGRRCSDNSKRNMDEKDWFTVDHIKPVAEGGLDIRSNARGLCRRCHEQVHETTPNTRR